ncbi:conserved hypothetical protein [Clostridiaceae bacterium BL-3]|nr:conserved hypothetical protein [Clostridiaceae bacterium BL-3]
MGKFFKLKNGQWLKILFSYCSNENVWYMTIVVSDSKRQCNDCIRKTENSPKVFFGQYTGRKAGLEPFIIALRELKTLEQTVSNCEIRVSGASSRLKNIYKWLIWYGYKIKNIKNFDRDMEFFYKVV